MQLSKSTLHGRKELFQHSKRPYRPTATSPRCLGQRCDLDQHGNDAVSRRHWVQAMLALVSVSSLPAAAYVKASSGLSIPAADVQEAIQAALTGMKVKGKAPTLLRLVFHDAGTFRAASADGGLNASIQLPLMLTVPPDWGFLGDGTNKGHADQGVPPPLFELDRPENKGLKKGWNAVLELHKQLQGTAAEGLVSRADCIALLGAAGVAATGGPTMPVAIGRADAVTADPQGRLPAESLSAAGQLQVFREMGLSPRDMVALLGSHTIGGKGFGDPLSFDAVYYQSLLRKPWLDPKEEMREMIGLPSDHVLPDDPVCRPIIEEYAQNQAAFFRDFAAAYSKLITLGYA